jgi:hypothetical protein
MFEGIRPKGNYALHIKSTGFDEPEAMELLRAAISRCHSMEIKVKWKWSIWGRVKTLRPHEKSLKEAD